MKEDLARRLLSDDQDALTVEVKDDDVGARNGNTFVELTAKGRPSGITTTQADYWMVAMPDGTVIGVPIAKMRDLVDEALAAGRVGYQRRGSHPTRGALVPLKWLIEPVPEPAERSA